MRVLLVCDMEGIAGIEGWPQCTPRNPQWTAGRRLLATQARAAVEGLLTAFDEVVVVDAHWASNNLPSKLFDDLPVTLVRGDLFDMTMTPYLSSVDALALLGLHAGAAHRPTNILAHTINSRVTSLEWRGKVIGETGLNILAAAYCGVPTVFVHGDVVACLEARNLVGGDLPCVPTKSPKCGNFSGGAWMDLASPEVAAAITRETCVVAGHLFSQGVRFLPSGMPECLELTVTVGHDSRRTVVGDNGLIVYQDLLDSISGRDKNRDARTEWHILYEEAPNRTP